MKFARIISFYMAHFYCDWYIEFIKSNFKDSDKSEETKNVSNVCIQGH